MPLLARVGRHTQNGGRHCQNEPDDQWAVMAMLNAISVGDGGAGGTLSGPVVGGVASDALYRAIVRFEDQHFPGQRSGFVDPGPGGRMLDLMEDMVSRLEEKAQDEKIRSLPHAYFAKISGVPGVDQYRGELGWIRLDYMAIFDPDNTYIVRQGGAAPPGPKANLAVTIYRPNGKGGDGVTDALHRISTPSGSIVERVEIVALKHGAVNLHFVLAQAEASDWVPEHDTVCRQEPDAFVMSATIRGFGLQPDMSFPGEIRSGIVHCSDNKSERITFTTPRTYVTWKFPAVVSVP